jgi:signal transduction histidine kinase
LTLLNTVVSAAALALACAAFLVYDQVTFRKNLVLNVSTQADVVGLNCVPALVFNDPDTAHKSISALANSPTVLAATLFTNDGRPFASYSRSDQDRINSIPPMANNDINAVVFFDSQVLVARKVDFEGKHVGTMVIRGDLSNLRRRLVQYVGISAIVLVLSLLAALVLSSRFRAALTSPIIALADTARVVSRQKNYAVRAQATGSRDEVDLLVQAFNEMLEQIQQRDSALETERARLGAIIDNAPFGIVLAELPTRRIIIANQQSDEILGAGAHPDDRMWLYSASALRDVDGQVLPVERSPMMRALTGEVIRGEEVIYVRPDRTQTWLRLFSAPIKDKAGVTVAIVLAFSDIAAQKHAHDALLQSEKLAAAGRLAASIAHEINNPLESVTNLLFLALNDGALSPETRGFLLQADQELARVSQIATQTLRFYRQSTKPTLANIGDLVDSVLHLLRGRLSNIHVHVDRQYRATHDLLCFEGELRQVFTNLISNAIDALGSQGGELMIRTAERHHWKTGKAGVAVTISDNGQGIPPDVLSRIFEPFYSTKGSRGTGLGLWVTKEIVGKHHGSIRVRSKLGQGTTFSIFFPYGGLAVDRTAAA